ncbi:ABC transporter substrate-binding protein [Streptomyces sp. NBC_01808]|uniref:ABC transporter substrate-binding protein n=1 Tax=Streptomyces sp. NBC_01808 TaxID=2975947 RepID=UPI002DD83215|nr:ABC transporter substrate-binding protein [Streptomyces sp. NBC_01808]WSA40536.1 ABC transporter substrate-binding protein [Streptomyces sp. NBC_01808]
MSPRTTRRTGAAKSRLVAVGALAAAGALVLSSCGDQTDDGGDSGDGGDTKSSSNAAPGALPKAIEDAGVIKVGSDIAYAPMEFDQGGKPVGVDIDIANALGEELGVEFQFQNNVFDNLIPSLDSGRFDIIMSSMTDNKERQAEVDFVDYFSAGVSILVQKGNPDGISTLDDLCGKTVAFQRGTVSADIAKAQNEKCDKPIKTLPFTKDTEALQQVKQGRAVADLNDFPVAAYNARESGGGDDFEVVGEQIDAAPYGIAVSKDNAELRDALATALDAIIENGEYQKVLEKWEVQQGGVDKATVNGGNE